MPSSFLEPVGLFNPLARYAFTNITDEDFTSKWDGQVIGPIKPRQTIELPHHLAVKLTKEMVDSIMIGKAKLDEVSVNQPYYRSPQGSAIGVPAARKVWEDQILRELQVDEESPEIQVMRAKIREELIEDMSKEVSKDPVHVPSSLSEFSELSETGTTKAAETKKPLKVKEIKLAE